MLRDYADDTTIFACGSDMCSILTSLEEDASHLSRWFENNYMKMNEDKSHLLVFGSKGEDVSVNISGSLIQESDEEKLLGLTLDRRLTFKIMSVLFVRKLAKSYMHWQEC